MCGIAPANVDDCGRFGDPACPYFGVGEPEPDGVTDEEIEREALKYADSDDGYRAFKSGAFFVQERISRPAIEPEGLPPRVGHILRLAEIIREVDSNHDKGAAALAEAILAHSAAINAQPAPVPVAERFEFSVFNSEYEEQAGGTAPTYAEAFSYGQHYLSRYSQDGPHSLEIRRVEVLPHHAMPVPYAEGAGLSDEEVLGLADDCGLEKQEITIWDGESRTVDHGWECTDAQLVTFATAVLTRYAHPTIEPVPVAERLPGPEDCNDEGEVWVEEGGIKEQFFDEYEWIPHAWVLREYSTSDELRRARWYPHNALPAPGAEVG
jgi:hypothetical protein